MFKKAAVSFAVISTLILNIFTLPIHAAPNPDEYNSLAVSKAMEKTSVFELKAKANILMDGTTGSVLLEKNSHEKLPIASVTKVMSMLLIMEAIDSGKLTLEDKVPVSEHAYGMGGSQVYLKPGEEFTVDEMLKAVAVHSANDATVALAEKVSGSEDAFVSKMNEKAKELGMNDTNFLDCTGLTDEGHYSSANDVALMSRELLMKHPKVTDYTTIWIDRFRDGKFELANTNKLIKFYPGANGLKTGFTSKAGYCLSAAAKKDNFQLIGVVLGEPDTNTRFAEARKLLDYGFANFELTQVNKKGEEVGEVEVKKGLKTKVKAVLGDDVKLLMNKAEKGKVTREVKLSSDIEAPVDAGKKVGEVIYRIGDKEVGKADAVAQEKVENASFVRLFFRMVVSWFGIGRK
ncbi:MAG: D-alanyl-D-alanine carboxypeptidase [Clostridia bacterium]|nr:D-alanyl-D-alanine carboxypeptidase [Clostridia bacterium]